MLVNYEQTVQVREALKTHQFWKFMPNLPDALSRNQNNLYPVQSLLS